MRTLLALFVVIALAVPLAALADGTTPPTPSSVAHQTCSQLKTALGTDAFAAKYGTNADKSNAFGKCVAGNTAAATATVNSAANACKTEQTKDPAAFLAKYGTNGKSGSAGADKNALGKCISVAVKQAEAAKGKAIAAAATSCKALRKSDPAGFAGKYGNKKNALGKCVAQTAKTK